MTSVKATTAKKDKVIRPGEKHRFFFRTNIKITIQTAIEIRNNTDACNQPYSFAKGDKKANDTPQKIEANKANLIPGSEAINLASYSKVFSLVETKNVPRITAATPIN